jgi:hypothetical protein
MSSPSDTRFAELEAQVASLKTQLEEQREMLATFVLPPELLRASSKGMKGMVEKLLAAGATAESTDEVKEREPCTQSRWRHWCACCQHP